MEHFTVFAIEDGEFQYLFMSWIVISVSKQIMRGELNMLFILFIKDKYLKIIIRQY